MGKPPDYNGALTNLTGMHSGEEWFLDRRFVVGDLPTCVCFLALLLTP